MASCCYFYISPAGKMTQYSLLQEALELLHDGGYIWIDAYQPERSELEAVAAALGLHPLAVEDCFDDNLVPKMEEYTESSFFIFNAFCYQEKQLSLQEINIFIGKKFLLTSSGHGCSLPGPFDDAQKITARNLETVKAGPSHLFHILLDHLVDHKYFALETLEDEMEAMEDRVMEQPDAFQAPELIRIRRQLLLLRKSLFHEREILVKICRRDCPFVAEKTIFHFRDIYDHLTKFLELTENYREVVSSQMELYMSVQNFKMARNSNETNAFIKRLTLITTIFMPLTLLAGIGGMSEWTMMTGQSNWKWAYPMFLAGMVLVGFVSYWLLKRIEKRRHREQEM